MWKEEEAEEEIMSTNVIMMPPGTEKTEPDNVLKLRASIDALAVELRIAQLRYDIATKQLELLQLEIKISDASIFSGKGNGVAGGGVF